MFKWVGDILKKVIVNLITIAVIVGVVYYFTRGLF